ncbi:RICIN domain-containing protein [Streptomyces kebangsaanensis]|uniref:RICIN domain-containing protein n=1 Tax=Streptomyces kebangsaanensis TaxID=864058 RepID=UPI00093CA93E|nr:RICIN domain-containing protein [Streptomyces kebangsaanensis]
MPTPHPARPSYPPPGGAPGESDEALAARLAGSSDAEVAHCVALLIARHWQPVHEYAVICLASSAPIASMVTSAAFHQVFDRLTLGEPGAALRPRLLVTVRDTVRLWAAEDRVTGVLPELRKPAGGRGMRNAVTLTPENRRLAQRSFEGLFPAARCLLWHTEVEAEPLGVPAGLLGVDLETAALTLEQAREKFREGCVRAHRELAPTDGCRFYNRLLDVPIRRGGDLLPDVRRHLDDCRYCRDAAEQLGLVESGLGELLAEAVLGWGAGRYLASRPDRAQQAPRTRGSGRHGGGRSAGGRRRLLPRTPASGRRVPGLPRPSRALRTGLGLASAGLLATVLGVSLWSGGGGTAPAASTDVTGAGNDLPGADSPAPTAGSATPGAAGLPPATGQTRLRNVSVGLCLAVRGEPKAGAAAELAECSEAWNQQWSLEEDGLLRSVGDPGLCLDSHADAGVVVLGTCAEPGTGRGPDVRYDTGSQGELLPRREKGLALAPASTQVGADVVVKVRDGSTAQRWAADSPSESPGSLSIAGTHTPPVRQVDLPDSTT